MILRWNERDVSIPKRWTETRRYESPVSREHHDEPDDGPFAGLMILAILVGGAVVWGLAAVGLWTVMGW